VDFSDRRSRIIESATDYGTTMRELDKIDRDEQEAKAAEAARGGGEQPRRDARLPRSCQFHPFRTLPCEECAYVEESLWEREADIARYHASLSGPPRVHTLDDPGITWHARRGSKRRKRR
jgi:hypothetical protein